MSQPGWFLAFPYSCPTPSASCPYTLHPHFPPTSPNLSPLVHLRVDDVLRLVGTGARGEGHEDRHHVGGHLGHQLVAHLGRGKKCGNECGNRIQGHVNNGVKMGAHPGHCASWPSGQPQQHTLKFLTFTLPDSARQPAPFPHIERLSGAGLSHAQHVLPAGQQPVHQVGVAHSVSCGDDDLEGGGG